MTDTEKALERWWDYDKAHSLAVTTWAHQYIRDGTVTNHPLWYADTLAASMLIGWAHRELLRRGYCMDMWDHTHDLIAQELGDENRCRVELRRSTTRELFSPGGVIDGPTLLDCYLDAIEATEKGAE